jgi:hypothetical protein
MFCFSFVGGTVTLRIKHLTNLVFSPFHGIEPSFSPFFYKRRPLDGTGGARHTEVPTMATRTPHFAAQNTGCSLTPPSVRQCVSEVNVWLFSSETPLTRILSTPISSIARFVSLHTSLGMGAGWRVEGSIGTTPLDLGLTVWV